MLPNRIVNIVGLSVVGSGQCSRGEVGVECQQLGFKAVGNRVGGPLATFFGQRIGCRKEIYGQPEAAEKMLSVNLCQHPTLQKAFFRGKNAVRNFQTHRKP